MLTGDMLRRATARFPDKTAIIWEGRHTTYTDLNAQANRFAHALAGLGLKKGEKVGIISRNRTEYGIVFSGRRNRAACWSTCRCCMRRMNCNTCSTRPMYRY